MNPVIRTALSNAFVRAVCLAMQPLAMWLADALMWHALIVCRQTVSSKSLKRFIVCHPTFEPYPCNLYKLLLFAACWFWKIRTSSTKLISKSVQGPLLHVFTHAATLQNKKGKGKKSKALLTACYYCLIPVSLSIL